MAKPRRYGHLFFLLSLLIAMAYIGVRHIHEHLILTWLFNITGIILFCGIVGHAENGYWRSLIIDSRCKISLSRIQLVAWSAVILGSILTAAIFNTVIQGDWHTPLNFEIPTELYLLMGISLSSMVASPALLVLREDAPDNMPVERLNMHVERLNEKRKQDKLSPFVSSGTDDVVRNSDLSEARWLDLFRGEKIANAASIDLAKIQMFLFTAIILFSYASAIAIMFSKAESAITMFPEIDGGLVTLIGISHSAYLANKAVPQK